MSKRIVLTVVYDLFLIFMGVFIGLLLNVQAPVAQFDDYDMPPRLIGTGCKGASGPLWADEEDEFPYPCKEIKVVPYYD